MPLILEILTERDLEAYAAGRLDEVERASVEQCARHDRRVAARLRNCRAQRQVKPGPPQAEIQAGRGSATKLLA